MSFTFKPALGVVPGDESGMPAAWSAGGSTSTPAQSSTPAGEFQPAGSGTMTTNQWGPSTSTTQWQAGSASKKTSSTASQYQQSSSKPSSEKKLQDEIRSKRADLKVEIDRRADKGLKALLDGILAGILDSQKVKEKAANLASETQKRDDEIKRAGRYNTAEVNRITDYYSGGIKSRKAEYNGAIIQGWMDFIKYSTGAISNFTPNMSGAQLAALPKAVFFAFNTEIEKFAYSKYKNAGPVSDKLLIDAAEVARQEAERSSKRLTSNDRTNLESLPVDVFEKLLAAAAAGTGFSDIGWSADDVRNKFFGYAYMYLVPKGASESEKKARRRGVLRIFGNAAANGLGVSDAVVKRLRNELRILEGGAGASYTASLYDGGPAAKTSSSWGASKGAFVSQKRAEAASSTAKAQSSWSRAQAAYARADAAKTAQQNAENRGDTSEASRLANEANAATSEGNAATQDAQNAENQANEANRAADTASQGTSEAAPQGDMVPAGGGSGGGSIAPLPPADMTPSSEPSVTGESPVVTTDATGTPAVVVPDQSVAPDTMPTVVVTKKPDGPPVGLLAALGIAAVVGGFIWFKNRRA